MSSNSDWPVIDRPVLVVGAGGHAKVLLSALTRLRVEVLGLVDSDPAKASNTVLGVPVLGDDQHIVSRSPDSILLVNGVGSVGPTLARRAVYQRFVAQGYRFATVVDPLSLIAGPVTFGRGAQVLAGAVLQPGVSLGDNCIVNTRASVDHDCIVGAHVHVAPGATLSGDTTVDEASLIGTGAIVIQGLRIGRESTVAAGAVVVSNVPDGVTVAEVPARAIRGRPA